MHEPPQVLVCFAVKEEASFLESWAKAQPHIRTLITGMGQRNAEACVRSTLSASRPKLVLSAGFAGGLRPGLGHGTVIFSGAEETGLEPALLKAGAQPARFHFSDRVATSPQEKARLRDLTGADAVEMESFAICTVCRAQRIPSAIVRVILDTAEDNLPLDFNEVLTADQRIDARKLSLALLKSPGKIGGLLRLRKQSTSAARELARVLEEVLRSLG